MVYTSPVGLATAAAVNSVSMLVTFKEKLCNSICANSTNGPESSVTYTYETPIFNGTTVFVPVVAKVTIITPTKCCQSSTQVITERFMVAFQGQTGLPTAVTITSEGLTSGLYKVMCGKSNSYYISDSIAVTITPAAA